MPKPAEILSVGYARLPPRRFTRIVSFVDYIIDTRSKPVSRKPGWSQLDLSRKFGAKYRWEGTLLGGLGKGVHASGLANLRALSDQGKRLLLICLEEAPGDCHRHRMIARRLLPDREVLHIYRDEVVTASELERSIRDESYEYASERLSAVLKRLGPRA